jgi:hypothetical protein
MNFAHTQRTGTYLCNTLMHCLLGRAWRRIPPPAAFMARNARPVRSACRQSLLQRITTISERTREEESFRSKMRAGANNITRLDGEGRRGRPDVDAHRSKGKTFHRMARRCQKCAHGGESCSGDMAQHLQQRKNTHVSEVGGRVAALEAHALPVPDLSLKTRARALGNTSKCGAPADSVDCAGTGSDLRVERGDHGHMRGVRAKEKSVRRPNRVTGDSRTAPVERRQREEKW